MAINPETQYPGKIAPSDADYPYGSARNVTTPGDGTGTPWEAAIVNDVLGFQQALLSEASVVPSGTPEKATASQYLTAIKKLAMITVPSMLALISAEQTALATVNTDSFYSGADKGGNIFIWDSAADKADHNGGTIIDPDHTVTPGATGWWVDENVGTGCWVAVTSSIDAAQFGLVLDGVADDGEGLKALLLEGISSGKLLTGQGIVKTTTAILIQDATGFKGRTLNLGFSKYRFTIMPTISSGWALTFDGQTRELTINGHLSLDGTNATGTAGGLRLNRTMSSSPDKLYVVNFPGTGVRIGNGWNQDFFAPECRNNDIGLHIEVDPTLDFTSNQTNNINLFGGSLSGNRIGLQINSSGSIYDSEHIKLFGVNLGANTELAIDGYNSAEMYIVAYFESTAAATAEMRFNDSSVNIVSPHTTGETGFIQGVNSKITINGLRIDKSFAAPDVLLDFIDCDVILGGNFNCASGGLGTFLKYEQTGTNSMSLDIRNGRVAGWTTLLDETFASNTRVRALTEQVDGLDPEDYDQTIRSSGYNRDGYFYVGPTVNKGVKIGNADTFGATDVGWIEHNFAGAIGYVQAVTEKNGVTKRSTEAGITADVSSVQGGGLLTKDLNEISTVGTAGDAVTLPPGEVGLQITIINNAGANACDVFPNTGNNLGAGLNIAVSLPAGSNITYACFNGINWESV